MGSQDRVMLWSILLCSCIGVGMLMEIRTKLLRGLENFRCKYHAHNKSSP